jgi:hypothetical protein
MPSDNNIEASISEARGATAPKAADKILDVAFDLFYREGIRAIGVDEIVRRAGVTKRASIAAFRRRTSSPLPICANTISNSGSASTRLSTPIRATRARRSSLS